MNYSHFILSGLCLGASFAGQAQTTAPAPAPQPHVYVGLGLYSSSHHNLSSWSGGARIPVQAMVGYQLRPRLAVQLGMAYSGNRSEYAYDYSFYPPSPTTASGVVGTFTERSATATLLARYTLTRKPAHRFQADLLGGVKVEYSHYRDVGTETSYGQSPAVTVATPYDYPSTYNSTLLSLGVSLRYRLASRLEAVYDLTFDQPVSHSARYSLRPEATMALGLRYHFG